MNRFAGFLPLFILRRLMKAHDGQLKQIIVLRTDLRMRRGKETAQGAHASMAVCLAHRWNPFVRIWLGSAFAKIVCGIDGEDALLALHAEAKRRGLPCSLIQDAGRTEFHGIPTYTSVAIGPGNPSDIAELTAHLKLR